MCLQHQCFYCGIIDKSGVSYNILDYSVYNIVNNVVFILVYVIKNICVIAIVHIVVYIIVINIVIIVIIIVDNNINNTDNTFVCIAVYNVGEQIVNFCICVPDKGI